MYQYFISLLNFFQTFLSNSYHTKYLHVSTLDENAHTLKCQFRKRKYSGLVVNYDIAFSLSFFFEKNKKPNYENIFDIKLKFQSELAKQRRTCCVNI